MNILDQYKTIKAKYPEAILLFRVGDFYHAYGEDAEILSKRLGLLLQETSELSIKTNTSFPHYSLDSYLQKLVRLGYKVAICEEVEKPQEKQFTKRGVTDFRA